MGLIFSYGVLVTQCLLRDKLYHDERAHPSASCIDNFAMQTREKNIHLDLQDSEKSFYFHVRKYKLIEFSIRDRKKIISRD